MKRALLIIFFFTSHILTFAQPGMGGDPNEGEIPITSGIVYLLLSALGLGIHKFVKAKVSK